MASTYLTEGLGEEGGASARGSTYTYTYESHYDLPPEDLSECEMIEDEEDRQGNKQTHKVPLTELIFILIMNYSGDSCYQSNNNSKC